MLRFTRYACICIMLLGLYLGYEQLTGNFHEVIKGTLYRSGQLSESQIAEYTERYGIASIVNLRGENRNEEWYITEVSAARKHHIMHLNFSMSSKRQLTYQQAQDVIKLIRKAPKPVLIHCRGGSERSGLATALYIAAAHPERDAASQLSARYGYFPYRYIGAPAMQETYEKFKDSLTQPLTLANENPTALLQPYQQSADNQTITSIKTATSTAP